MIKSNTAESGDTSSPTSKAASSCADTGGSFVLSVSCTEKQRSLEQTATETTALIGPRGSPVSPGNDCDGAEARERQRALVGRGHGYPIMNFSPWGLVHIENTFLTQNSWKCLWLWGV